MEAAGLAFSVAQTLFAALQSSELKEIFSIYGYESELQRLESSVSAIKSVLLDADSKQEQGLELLHQELDFVEKLKDAVYDADDLLDEFITRHEQQKLLGSSKRQVCRLFSTFQKLGFACKVSWEVKKIRKKLDGIASDATNFGFKVDYQPIRGVRKEETCSYVYAETVIGREDDKRKIVDMLLDPNVDGIIPVLTIVGIGGLGKTALAQLVFNDDRIQKEFPMRLWVCVSDQDQKQLNVKALLASILKSATDDRIVNELGVEQLVRKLRDELNKSKYLLVLDDVWSEDRGEWLKLEGYLSAAGQRGNRIVVTTRSKRTAVVVGSNITYELGSLSEDNAWNLFEHMVGKEHANQNDLVDMGREIIGKCANVPLAIKVVGSLLYGQGKNKWQFIQHSRLSEIGKGENGIMPALKFSYYHLPPFLKSCFSYCAVFPKDLVIQKGG